MKSPRLSPYQIEDDLVRAALYREIKKGNVLWPKHEIQPDEVSRPDLAAHRIYGMGDLKWVVMILTGLDDPRNDMTAGVVISYPSVAWIRERIKHYKGEL
jgi:hypothetical protein